jgi:hypothetical protein
MWEGCHRTIWAVKLSDKKKREMGGPLALDGHCLMGGHNNQPKVGVNGGGALERRRDRGGTCGGVLSLRSGRQIEQKKTKNKRGKAPAFGGRQSIK